MREVVAADATDVFVFRSDYEVQYYNGPPMKDLAEAVTQIDLMAEKFKAQECICWGITLREEKRVVGLCSFHNISAHQRSVSIGYDLARTHWRQGIATEAVGVRNFWSVAERVSAVNQNISVKIHSRS